MKNLTKKTLLGFKQLITVLGILLLAPARTFGYWRRWVYLLVFAVSSALITAHVWIRDPKLLQRRLKAAPGAEKDRSQKVIQRLASFVFIGAMVIPSLDHRFSWSSVPLPAVVAGDALVMLGFLSVFLVFKENTLTAATIEVAPDQRVISTGPYAVVPHPMYSGAFVMLLGTPLTLGSWWGLLMFIPMVLTIRWRALARRGAASLEGSSRLRGILPDGSASSYAVCLVIEIRTAIRHNNVSFLDLDGAIRYMAMQTVANGSGGYLSAICSP